ncbi:hypothetical protein Q3G72_035038 [Acer saccharum]|nr:hypothetical protein Q3G72_035038 [Acer saccharum]
MNDVVDLYPNCFCGKRARRCTSWTNSNPGRRLFGCSKFQDDDNCGFFRWYDPPICARSKKIISALLRRISELEMRLGEDNRFEVSSAVIVDEEVSSAAGLIRNSHSIRNWFGLLVLAIGIFFVVGKNYLDNL